MNWVVRSEWADALSAEGQAFNQISQARDTKDRLKAWATWGLAIQRLRQEARRPEREFELADEE
jgi:hypothetical protein